MSRLLAFVDIFVESPEMDNVVEALSKLDNIEDLYEVTGEFDIVALFSASNIEELRNILKNRIMKIKGVKSTVSSIIDQRWSKTKSLHLRNPKTNPDRTLGSLRKV
jgi:DNA-binding Lrp family transcriptional regulator